MKIQDLSVRHRLILNNIIMVFVPVLLLIIIGSTVFYGLRATGNFREREIELLWPEAGNSAPILMGLSHIFTNVDGGERESLGRHVESMEAAGIEVAVVRDGVVVYETVPGQARELIDTSYELASGEGNVLRWDDAGLVYRYVSKDKKSIGVAIGTVPFLIGRGFFPPHMGLVWSLIAIGVFLLAAAVIVFIGLLLVRRMTRDIVAPLEDLQHASRRIASGDYDTPVASCSTDELGETAAVFEEMRRQLQAGRKMRDAYEKNRQELFAGIAHDLDEDPGLHGRHPRWHCRDAGEAEEIPRARLSHEPEHGTDGARALPAVEARPRQGRLPVGERLTRSPAAAVRGSAEGGFGVTGLFLAFR